MGGYLLDVFGRTINDRMRMIRSIAPDPGNYRVMLTIRKSEVDGAAEGVAHIADSINHGLAWRAQTRIDLFVVVGFKAHVVDNRYMHFQIEVLLLHTQIGPHSSCCHCKSVKEEL